MKECFRNWVLTREKLYKLIVFVIALVAFLAVTAHGCKTMKADAATTVSRELINYAISLNRGIDNIVILQDTSGNYYTMVETLKDDDAYLNGSFIVTSHNSCSPILVTPNWWLHKWYRITENRTSEEVSFSHSACTGTHILEHGLQFVYSSKPVLAMGGTDDNGDGIYFSCEPVVELRPEFYVNAPFVQNPTYFCSNFLNAVDGAYRSLDLSEMYFNYQGTLTTLPNLNPTRQEITYYVDVYMPTQEWVNTLIENYSSLAGEKAFVNWYYDEYDDWYAAISANRTKYRIYDVMVIKDCTAADTVRLSLTYEDLKESILSDYTQNGTFDELYDLSNAPWGNTHEEIIENYIWNYMTVGCIETLVDTQNDVQWMYGRVVSTVVRYNLPPINFEYAYDSINSDENTPDFDEEIDKAILNAYLDNMNNLQSEKDELQSVLDNYYMAEGAFSDYSASDIWGYLTDTSKGLVSVTGAVSGLAAVVGVVFGFLPAQISGMIMTLFVICIFTAIIRFIRG